MLVIIAFIATVLALSKLAGIETRILGAPRLAPKLFYGFIAGIIFLFYLDDAMVSSRAEETIRVLFNLPDDIKVERVYGGNKNPVCYRKSVYHSTTVQFTPVQLARYVASIHDRKVWRPVLPPHYLAHKSRLQFADDALVWQELPEPKWIGKQQLVWRIAGRDVRRGLALCYTVNRVDQQEQASADSNPTTFSVTQCNPRSRTKIPTSGARVTAALDFDKHRLAIAINFDSKPDYCNNRVSNLLGAALGLDAK